MEPLGWCVVVLWTLQDKVGELFGRKIEVCKLRCWVAVFLQDDCKETKIVYDTC